MNARTLTLRNARQLVKQAEELQERADRTLKPLYDEVVARIQAMPKPLDGAQIDALLRELYEWPPGFYRSELRTLINNHTPRA